MENKILFFGSVVFWALILSSSLLWNIYSLKNSTLNLVNSVGQTFFEEIKLTRLWNARHGGVYVPVTEQTQPNPHLKVPNRDITTIQGLKLTLINPAYMARQIAEIARNERNFQFHLTSLKPIRPQNKPDEWEKKVLTDFEKGSPGITEYFEDKAVFRYMAPLYVRQACLKCHVQQGYKTGDIRGGISVTLPAKAYTDTYQKTRNILIIVHSVFFLAGSVVLYSLRRFRARHLVILNKKNIQLENEAINRARVEEALAEKSMYLDNVLRSASESAIVTTDLDLRISYYNPLAEEFFGYSADEVIGKTIQEMHIMESESFERLEKAIEQVRIHGEYYYEATQKSNVGTRYLKSRVAGITNSAEELIGFALFSHDITKRKQVEKALRDSEEKYRNVVQNAIEAICVVQDGMFKYFNPEAVRLFGYTGEELEQLPSEDTIYPEDKSLVTSLRMQRQAGEHVSGIYSHRIITKDGRILWVEIKAVTITWNSHPAVLVFLTEITDRKKSEELMIQTEKMMTVGGLAAGMAHEINNPLGAVLQGVQIIQRRLSPDLKSNQGPAEEFGIDLHNLQQYMEKRGILSFFEGIKESGRKTSYIISNMLQFSRKSESRMAPHNLVELIDNVLELAGKEYDLKKRYDFRNIKVVKEFDSSLPLVPCTETEIQQVMLNLLTNAAWAMSNEQKSDPAQIIIRIHAEKEMARIEVEDNGPGMDEETRKRIFEPFFTTKPVGQGTGLGLSVSYMIIVNNHKGMMEVESEPEKGTRFILKIPLNRE